MTAAWLASKVTPGPKFFGPPPLQTKEEGKRKKEEVSTVATPRAAISLDARAAANAAFGVLFAFLAGIIYAAGFTLVAIFFLLAATVSAWNVLACLDEIRAASNSSQVTGHTSLSSK